MNKENRLKNKEIEYILDHAEVIENNGNSDNSKVDLGKRVKIKDYRLNQDQEFILVTAQEANLSEKKISVDSPIGRAILGRKKETS